MLSEKIYRLRRQSGLSQEQLAEKLGVSRQAISKWESGSSVPELDKLTALSECFHITLDELVREEADTAAETAPQNLPAEGGHGNAVQTKVGAALCLAGAAALLLIGVLLLVSPQTADTLNAASAITLNGSGIAMLACVAAMAAGLVLLLRKK